MSGLEESAVTVTVGDDGYLTMGTIELFIFVVCFIKLKH